MALLKILPKQIKELGVISQEEVYQIPSIFKEFNELIGLPKHPATMQPMPLMPYQENLHKIIIETKRHKFHINKARQIGFTEIILRIMAFESFGRYAGGKIKIIAGTREAMAKKEMHRFQLLFKNIWDQVVESSTDKLLILKNGTEIEALPSNSEAIRGDTQIKAIFLDEAAHYNLIDDSVVMDAIGPIVDTNKSDLFMISTPNGKRGFFYEIDINDNDYLKMKYRLEDAGWLYSQDDIKQMLSRKDIDVEQEYLNQYTSTRQAVFGSSFNQEYFEAETY